MKTIVEAEHLPRKIEDKGMSRPSSVSLPLLEGRRHPFFISGQFYHPFFITSSQAHHYIICLLFKDVSKTSILAVSFPTVSASLLDHSH